MELLRTPEEAFADLPGYPFGPHYVEVPTGDGDQTLREAHAIGAGLLVLALATQKLRAGRATVETRAST